MQGKGSSPTTDRVRLSVLIWSDLSKRRDDVAAPVGCRATPVREPEAARRERGDLPDWPDHHLSVPSGPASG